MQRLLFSILMMTLGTVAVHAHAKQQQIKDWNMLVFINGVNNLDYFGAKNINQMEDVGSNEKMNILVQWGSMADDSVKRLHVQKDNDQDRVTSPVVDDMGQVDMGDWKELVKFAEWANANYPAKHTFIVVWNHGSGWRRLNNFAPRDISYDDRTGNYITTEQLGVAMADIAKILGKKVDIYGSDACLMGMVEVADEMSASVDYFVGSQDLEPGDGWPYSPFLQKWAANPELNAKEVAQLLSKEFLAAYDGGVYGEIPVTLSVYDLSKLPAFNKAIAELANELMSKSAPEMKKMKEASNNTKYFTYSDYLDLWDFMDQMENQKVTASAVDAVRKAQSELVIANDQNVSSSTHGLSIWIPNSWNFGDHWERYQNLNFHKNTGWGNFVQKLAEE